MKSFKCSSQSSFFKNVLDFFGKNWDFFYGNATSLLCSQRRPHGYISVISADTSSAHLKLFNSNGQSLFLLCSAGHLMCHPDWRRSRGPICKCCLAENFTLERHSSKALCPFFSCLSITSSARRSGVGRRFRNLLRWSAPSTWEGAINVHFLFLSAGPADREALDSWAQVKTLS